MNSKRHGAMLVVLQVASLGAPWLHSDERKIDPTFLYRDTAAAKAKPSDLTTAACHYKPLFGQGDADASALAGIARYGEAVITLTAPVPRFNIQMKTRSTLCSTERPPSNTKMKSYP